MDRQTVALVSIVIALGIANFLGTFIALHIEFVGYSFVMAGCSAVCLGWSAFTILDR